MIAPRRALATIVLALAMATGCANQAPPTAVPIPHREVPRCVAYALCPSYTLVSVPMRVADSSLGALFPGAIRAETYDSGGAHRAATTLAPGLGYLVLADSTAPILRDTICGLCLHEITVTLHAGYNLLGSLCDTVRVDQLVADGACFDRAQVFRFECADSMWTPTSVIAPGGGVLLRALEESCTVTLPRPAKR